MVEDIDDEYLVSLINTAAISIIDCLDDMPLGSSEFEIYLSGISYGIWISCCDFDFIGQKQVYDSIKNTVLVKLN